MIPTTWWEDLLTWWESGTWEDRPFLGAMPNPSLGWFLLVGCCLSCLGSFFFCLFWGRCQIPRLGVSCSSGAAFRAWVLFFCFLFFAFFGGDAKSLAWVFLARRVLPAENWPRFLVKKNRVKQTLITRVFWGLSLACCDQMTTSAKWNRVFGRVVLVSEDILKIWKYIVIYPNFAFQLNQGPTFRSEIRSRMNIHLVELEAMQTVSSLQNGCATPSLEFTGGLTIHLVVAL